MAWSRRPTRIGFPKVDKWEEIEIYQARASEEPELSLWNGGWSLECVFSEIAGARLESGTEVGIWPARFGFRAVIKNPKREAVVESHPCAKSARGWGTLILYFWKTFIVGERTA